MQYRNDCWMTIWLQKMETRSENMYQKCNAKRAFIFRICHYVEVFYQSYSCNAPWGKNGPALGFTSVHWIIINFWTSWPNVIKYTGMVFGWITRSRGIIIIVLCKVCTLYNCICLICANWRFTATRFSQILIDHKWRTRSGGRSLNLKKDEDTILVIARSHKLMIWTQQTDPGRLVVAGQSALAF